jgi:hypothetical protein
MCLLRIGPAACDFSWKRSHLMANEIDRSADNAIAAEARERLEELKRRANVAHHRARGAMATVVEQALEAGNALLEARDICPRGKWLAWLDEHFDGTARTAQRYLQAAKLWQSLAANTSARAPLPLRQTVRLLSSLFDDGEAADTRATGDGKPLVRPAREQPLIASVRTEAPSQSDDAEPLAAIFELFERLVATLGRFLAQYDGDVVYGRMVLEDLERIRPDLEVLRDVQETELADVVAR